MMTSIDRARNALRFVPAHDRDVWVKMAMSLKSEFGDEGHDVWMDWSQHDHSFNLTDAKAVWKSVDANGMVTIETLFHEAGKYG